MPIFSFEGECLNSWSPEINKNSVLYYAQIEIKRKNLGKEAIRLLFIKSKQHRKHEVQMKITPIDLKKIKIDDTNPNRMTDEKKEALKKSIEKFGELQPVIVDKHFKLIDGEHRYHAYRQLGKLQIP
ncbi:MAG: ParB/RepB/Spo0J family partition protein, partial [Patescibacteria group bacterium]